MFTIFNETLALTLNPKGAEILSISNKQTQLNYLWNGDPAYWPKTSPVLFPVVGGLKDNSYQYKGNTYQMGRHGFGRESVYTVSEQSESSITFTLIANEATLKVYPFHFQFSVKYHVEGNKVSITYIVENTGSEALLFSVGAHPAFNVPLAEGTVFSDYYLLFDQSEKEGRYSIGADGLIAQKSTPLLENTNKLPLQNDLFYNDALVFKNLRSTSISILNDKTSHGLKVQFNNFPFMGIWQPKDAPFLCIEPWCGLGDMEGTTSQLQEKEGINTSQPGEVFTRTWSVEVF
jgi:galactose mutarotase-like enzyme